MTYFVQHSRLEEGNTPRTVKGTIVNKNVQPCIVLSPEKGHPLGVLFAKFNCLRNCWCRYIRLYSFITRAGLQRDSLYYLFGRLWNFVYFSPNSSDLWLQYSHTKHCSIFFFFHFVEIIAEEFSMKYTVSFSQL